MLECGRVPLSWLPGRLRCAHPQAQCGRRPAPTHQPPGEFTSEPGYHCARSMKPLHTSERCRRSAGDLRAKGENGSMAMAAAELVLMKRGRQLPRLLPVAQSFWFGCSCSGQGAGRARARDGCGSVC